MQLFLIGASLPEFQKEIRDVPNGLVDDFLRRVRQVSKCFYIKTIAEEKFIEASDDGVVSLCLDAAKELSVAHIFCDSDKSLPARRGRSIERDRFAAEQQEIAWLSRIKNAEFPVLFVCGSHRVDSFAKKCREEAINVMLLERNWEP